MSEVACPAKGSDRLNEPQRRCDSFHADRKDLPWTRTTMLRRNPTAPSRIRRPLQSRPLHPRSSHRPARMRSNPPLRSRVRRARTRLTAQKRIFHPCPMGYLPFPGRRRCVSSPAHSSHRGSVKALPQRSRGRSHDPKRLASASRILTSCVSLGDSPHHHDPSVGTCGLPLPWQQQGSGLQGLPPVRSAVAGSFPSSAGPRSGSGGNRGARSPSTIARPRGQRHGQVEQLPCSA